MIATPVLSDGQIADFHRDGYVVVPKVFDRNNMATFEQWATEVENLPEEPGLQAACRDCRALLCPQPRSPRHAPNLAARARERAHAIPASRHRPQSLIADAPTHRRRTPREAVAGGYGCIFVLITPTGAVLVAQILIIVSEDG